MIATTTTRFTFVGSASALPQATVARRRRISPDAGRALEKLGHAIEYLTQQFVEEDGASSSFHDNRLEAVELLMGLHREVYYEAPEAPTLRERLSTLLRRSA